MNAFKPIKELIALAEAYQEQTSASDWDKEGFISWLISEATKADHDEDDTVPAQDGLVAMLLTGMYKYAQFYARRVFRDTAVYSLDDFSVLISLYPDAEHKKIDVLRMCIQEKSSGNEVLKRLLREGMVQERENPADARSKLLSLTEKGKRAFEQIQTGIEKMSAHLTGDLTGPEKQQLLQLLFKLHQFHKPFFDEPDEDQLRTALDLSTNQ